MVCYTGTTTALTVHCLFTCRADSGLTLLFCMWRETRTGYSHPASQRYLIGLGTQGNRRLIRQAGRSGHDSSDQGCVS